MRPPPPVLALVAALAQQTVTGEGHPPGPARVVTAGGVALASGACAFSAVRRFGQSGTTLDPLRPAEASTLVTTGANALTRNPMYVGLAGLLVANALRRGSWTALLPVVGFVATIGRVQIAAEETALSGRFGADYAAYRAAVPRWLGRRSVALPLGR